MKRKLHIGVRVLTWAISVLGLSFLVGRMFGVPEGAVRWLEHADWSRALAHSISRFIGERRVIVSTEGQVLSTEIFRGQRVPLSGGYSLTARPLIKGDYYMPDGTRISGVRRGTGVRLRFDEVGAPETLDVFRDGASVGPYVIWAEAGRVSHYGGYDVDGRRNGWQVSYFSNGEKESESRYEHGRRQGRAAMWYESGQMRGLTLYSNGYPQVWQDFGVAGEKTAEGSGWKQAQQ